MIGVARKHLKVDEAGFKKDACSHPVLHPLKIEQNQEQNFQDCAS
jgi:hypothetical protein